ncbi:MAG TPA: hypothetical protein VGA20_11190, partial [Gemmatimonadales bacterium]
MDDVLKAQALEMWRINNAAHQMLLDGISTEGLQDTMSTRGGRTVALQFAHVHNVRLAWLEIVGKEWLKDQKKIDAKGKVDRALLKRRLQESEEGIGRVMTHAFENEGQVKGFKRGVLPML